MHYRLITLLLFSATIAMYGQTDIGGSVSGEWTAQNSPYIVTDDITIAVGESLTIQPGVHVKFQWDTEMTVRGTLTAQGAEGDSVYFEKHEGFSWLGINISDASGKSIFSHCVIRDVQKPNPTYFGWEDGAVYVENSSVKFEYSTICNNNSEDEGALKIINGDVEIIRSKIENNRTDGNGGGIYAENSTFHIQECEFNSNGGGFGGGGIYAEHSTINISSSSFTGNGSSTGGALYLFYSNLHLINSLLQSNGAQHYGGGAIRFSSDENNYLLVSNTEFHKNRSYKLGGTLYLSGLGTTVFDRCTFTESHGSYDGNSVLKSSGGSSVFNNCVFYQDNAIGSYNTDAFVAAEGTLNITNSVITNSNFKIVEGGSIQISYSNVEGGYEGTGNIDADPMFTAPDDNDFSVLTGSPCIDTGSPLSFYDDADGSRNDMGAAGGRGIVPGGTEIRFAAIQTGSSATKQWGITNLSNTEISISEATISDDQHFTLTEQLPSSISPGETGSLELTFNPQTSTEFEELLTIDWSTGGEAAITTLPVFGESGLSGSVSGTWTKEFSPYVVSGDLLVEEGNTLTINSGVRIEFKNKGVLEVDGQLVVNGSESENAVFTNAEGYAYWRGVRLNNTGAASSLMHCVIENAQADGYAKKSGTYGGGLFVNSPMTAMDNIIVRNCSAERGGGVYIQNNDIQLIDCTINNNYAESWGGGVFSEKSVILEGCSISGNVASQGGAGFSSSNSITLYMISCQLIENDGGWGAAIYASDGMIYFVNSLATKNICSGTGLIYSSDGSILAGNSVIWDNPEVNGLALRGNRVFAVNSIINGVSWEAPINDASNISYCNVEGGAYGTGNIDVAPSFADETNLNFSLADGSPCIDAGDPNPIYNDADDTRNDMGLDGGRRVFLWPGSILEFETIAVSQTTRQYFSIENCSPEKLTFASIAIEDGTNFKSSSLQHISEDGINPFASRGGYINFEPVESGELTDRVLIEISGSSSAEPAWINLRGESGHWTGRVSGTWTKQYSPYSLGGDITIATLTIEPGVTLVIDPVVAGSDVSITIAGTLTAEGTEAEPIVFTSTGATSPGWRGLITDDESNIGRGGRVVMKYCRVENAEYGIALMSDHSSNIIENSVFVNNEKAGIYVNGNAGDVDGKVSKNTISGNGWGIIYESHNYAGDVEVRVDVEENLIMDNTLGGIKIEALGEKPSSWSATNQSSFGIAAPVLTGNTVAQNLGPAIYINSDGDIATSFEGTQFYSYADAFLSGSGNLIYENTGGIVAETGSLFADDNRLSHTTVALERTTFWNNLDGHIHTGASTNILLSNSIFRNSDMFSEFSNARPTIVWSAVSEPVEGEGNTTDDPLMADPGNYDFSLTAGSPCIDAGSLDSLYDADGTIADLGALFYDQTIAPFSLIEPANQAEIDSFTVHFSWERAATVHNDVLLYSLLVSQDNLFSGYGLTRIDSLTSTEYTMTEAFENMRTYYWKVSAVNQWGNEEDCSSVYRFTIDSSTVTSVTAETGIPTEYSVSQNYPNPFNPVTSIRYGLPEAAMVTVDVFSVTGVRVARLVNGYKPAGYHSETFNSAGLPSGIYLYRVQAGPLNETKKMILLK